MSRSSRSSARDPASSPWRRPGTIRRRPTLQCGPSYWLSTRTALRPAVDTIPSSPDAVLRGVELRITTLQLNTTGSMRGSLFIGIDIDNGKNPPQRKRKRADCSPERSKPSKRRCHAALAQQTCGRLRQHAGLIDLRNDATGPNPQDVMLPQAACSSAKGKAKRATRGHAVEKVHAALMDSYP